MKGQGLTQLLTERNVNVAVNCTKENHTEINAGDEWYRDIIYFLKNLTCYDHRVDC